MKEDPLTSGRVGLALETRKPRIDIGRWCLFTVPVQVGRGRYRGKRRQQFERVIVTFGRGTERGELGFGQ